MLVIIGMKQNNDILKIQLDHKEKNKDKKFDFLKVAITGAIGSGKSTVSNIYKNIGFTIIDADLIAKEVFNEDLRVMDYLRRSYSNLFLLDGSFDRKKFAEIIFKDKEKLKEYENIILPLIKEKIIFKTKEHFSLNKDYDDFEMKDAKKRVVFIDAPTLFEDDNTIIYDLAVSVIVDPNTQISRVMNRDHLNKKDIINRINNQVTNDIRIKLSDYIIENNSSLLELEKNSLIVLEEIVRRLNDRKKDYK